MPILRVFPRQTKATPQDEYVAIGSPGLFIPDDITEIHISVAFTWDMFEAERLAEEWSKYGNVKLGGPAFNEPGGEFIPGMYLKPGYVITSRGCPNHCWFCAVPKREHNGLHELVIHDGWNVLDDNLLACSEEHIRSVFCMLKRQKHKARFTGGLEAKSLRLWHCKLLAELKPEQMYFAYDTPDDYEPLRNASNLLKEVGILDPHKIGCYCLIGYSGDTFQKAETRLLQIVELGMRPYAMLMRDNTGKSHQDWSHFQARWLQPKTIFSMLRRNRNALSN